MSLKSFVELPEVRAKFDAVHPSLPRKIGAPLKVAPRTKRYMLVGTAFDYLLRFEIQRRAPHARAPSWVAKFAPDRVWQPGYFVHLPPAVGLGEYDSMEDEEAAAKALSDRMRVALEKARAVAGAYAKNPSPTCAEQAELAGHAIRLAKLDGVARTIRPDPQFEDTDAADVQDLLDLLAVVPWGELIHDKVLLLNPTFGESSRLVGGADADLIAGDMLIDLKTTKAGAVTAAFLDQLLGYLLLARNERRFDPTFPEIKRLSVYFCRHGYVWAQDVSLWTSHPAFAELERWYFGHAREVLGPNRQQVPPA